MLSAAHTARLSSNMADACGYQLKGGACLSRVNFGDPLRDEMARIWGSTPCVSSKPVSNSRRLPSHGLDISEELISNRFTNYFEKEALRKPVSRPVIIEQTSSSNKPTGISHICQSGAVGISGK